jgi:dCTP deaminase
MILSNVDILAAIDAGRIVIEPLAGRDVSRPPFQTSAIDLRLAPTITVPRSTPTSHRLDRDYDRAYYAQNSDRYDITDTIPYILKPNFFVLAQTLETLSFPTTGNGPYYAARIEGRSSLSRYGMLVHFTAPTIHGGFGPARITLEIINLGRNDILLTPNVRICQLIIEEISCRPDDAPNQFRTQTSATG